MPHIFISYAKKDTRELALALADALNGVRGVSAWVDRSLRAGQSWETQIQREINRCDVMVVLYSPDINRHLANEDESYVLTEIRYAKYTVKKPIIPVMAQQTDAPMSMTGVQYIDYTLPDMTLDDLVAALGEAIGFQQSIEHSLFHKNTEHEQQLSAVEIQKSIPTSVHTAVQRARSFSGRHNRDWEPFVTTFADLPIPHMTFCLVPIGTFQMGNDDKRFPDEMPVHMQVIHTPYWIGQFPVTNMQWRIAVDAKVVNEPSGRGSALKWYSDPNMANAPVVGIDWFNATKFATWLGCQLQSELQWEYAARGVESLRFPWGNDWESDYAIWQPNSKGQPAGVMSNFVGRSWVDACHMIGNVWEWTSSLYKPYPYAGDAERELDMWQRTGIRRTLRGGSWWDSYDDLLRSTCRKGRTPDGRNDLRGLRIVRQS